MTAQQALCKRIQELMAHSNIKINTLAERAGIHHSTLDAILANDSQIKNTGITTIKKICQGLNIDFEEFWQSDIFKNLDYEE